MKIMLLAPMLIPLIFFAIGYVEDAKARKQKRRRHEWKVANNAYAADSMMTDPEANR